VILALPSSGAAIDCRTGGEAQGQNPSDYSNSGIQRVVGVTQLSHKFGFAIADCWGFSRWGFRTFFLLPPRNWYIGMIAYLSYISCLHVFPLSFSSSPDDNGRRLCGQVAEYERMTYGTSHLIAPTPSYHFQRHFVIPVFL